MVYLSINRYQENVNTLLHNLIKKIRNFAVLDKQSKLLGRIKDLILDAHHQPNIIIARIGELKDKEDGHRYFLLPSKLIKKIDTQTKSVLVDIDKSLLENMPENYHSPITDTNEQIEPTNLTQVDNLLQKNTTKDDKIPEKVVQEEVVPLLEERVIVDRSKRKVGDVIVRKQIETRMIQIPVRREKLIVEQVSPEHKQLAEIELCQEEISNIQLTAVSKTIQDTINGFFTVSGSFNSPKIASLVLNAIALEKNHGCKQVRVTITVEDEKQQQKYQEWFDRTSVKNPES
jgi:hypothetical protein